MLEKACSMGFKSGEYEGRKISLHSSGGNVSKYNNTYNEKHTCFILNKLSYIFSMVNVAIVQNKNTSRPRVGICKGNLVSV